MRKLSLVVGFAFVAATIALQADAGDTKSSASKVKASATAGKVGADGKQTVTITLDITKGWHLYANPVNHNNDFLESAQTTVKIGGKEKVKFDVKYPAGKTKIDKKEKYDIYEGTVKIEAVVLRAKGDTNPLEVTIEVSACDDKNCLAPGKIKLTAK